MNEVKIETYTEFINAIATYDVKRYVLLDVDKRIADWLLAGGSMDDDYIKQQYKYVERAINTCLKIN